MNMIKTTLSAFILVLVLGFSAQAQLQHVNPENLGLGGGGTAYVDGFNANFVNPANLMLKKHRRNNTTIGLGAIGLRFGGTLTNIPVYNNYLTSGQTIDNATADAFLDDLFGSSDPGEMRSMNLNLEAIVLGVSVRGEQQSFSFAVRNRTFFTTEFSRGFLELGFYGLDAQQFGTPRDVNLGIEALNFTEVSVGYARRLLKLPNLLFAKNIELYAGVAPKFLIGTAAGDFEMNSTVQVVAGPNDPNQAVAFIHDFSYRFETYGDLGSDLNEFTIANQLNVDESIDDYFDNADALASPGLNGIAFDLGTTAVMDISGVPFLNGPLFGKKTLTIGFSLTDLGSAKFDDNPVIINNQGRFEFNGAEEGQDINEFFEDILIDSLDQDIYGNFDVDPTDDLVYELPGRANLGAHLQMGKLGTSLDYSFGFNGVATNSQFSTLILGAEYRFFNFIPIRVGVRNGGFTSRVYTAGLGLDFKFLDFTFAAALPSKKEASGSAVSFAWSGLKFRF